MTAKSVAKAALDERRAARLAVHQDNEAACLGFAKRAKGSSRDEWLRMAAIAAMFASRNESR